MLTLNELNNLKPGDYIEEPSTDSICEYMYVDVDGSYWFQTIHSSIYPLDLWKILVNTINSFNNNCNFSKCSKDRLQYYKKLMVFK